MGRSPLASTSSVSTDDFLEAEAKGYMTYVYLVVDELIMSPYRTSIAEDVKRTIAKRKAKRQAYQFTEPPPETIPIKVGTK